MPTHSKLILVISVFVILFVALFPFGWVAKLSPGFRSWLDWAFPEPWGHIFGHATLFCLVGLALLLAFPGLQNRLWIYVAVLALVAVGQEVFQLLYKGRTWGLNDVLDLVPDLAGAALAWLAVRAHAARRALAR